jgi:hypothetical protein
MIRRDLLAYLAVSASLAFSATASAGNSGIPELCEFYPSTPDCSCNINPYNVVCGLSGWGNVPDLRDGVTPPDPQFAYHHVVKTANNPYYATCWSSSADRYAYATWEILNGHYGGDWNQFSNPWQSAWFFVVYSDNTLSEGYAQSDFTGADVYQESYMETCGRPPMPWQLP